MVKNQKPEASSEPACRAKDELKKARKSYEQLRRQATDKLRGVREKRIGDLIDGTLELVKKHPAGGITIAAAIGFFLGRLFRR